MNVLDKKEEEASQNVKVEHVNAQKFKKLSKRKQIDNFVVFLVSDEKETSELFMFQRLPSKLLLVSTNTRLCLLV